VKCGIGPDRLTLGKGRDTVTRCVMFEGLAADEAALRAALDFGL